MSATALPRHPELVSGSISALRQRWQSKSDGKVRPMWILALEQVDLPLPMPSLELFLTGNRARHVAEHLEMNEAVDVVTPGEAGNDAVAMLPEPARQVRRDADVERAIMPIGKDVDARVSLEWHTVERAPRWMLKQVQHDEVE